MGDEYSPYGRRDRWGRKLPPIGPRMTEALEFIQKHPGCSKADMRRALGRIGRNAVGVDSVDRLLRRGLVYDLGSQRKGARYMLYAPLGDAEGTAHP